MAKPDSESNYQRVRTVRTSGTVNVVIACIFIVVQLSIIGFVFHLHQELIWLEENPPFLPQEQDDYQLLGLPAKVDTDVINEDIHLRQKRESENTISKEEFRHMKKIIDSYFENPSASSHLCLGNVPGKFENLNWTLMCQRSSAINNRNDIGLGFIPDNILGVTRSGFHYIYLQLAATNRGFPEGWTRPLQCVFYVEVARARKQRARETLLTLQISRFGSSYTGGVFLLHEDDQLNVRPEVTNQRCQILPYKEQSFFGLFILSPDYISPPSTSYQHYNYRM